MGLVERLTELRKKAGLSQEDLSEKLNISRQAVSKWERGESTPDIDNLTRIGEIYGVSMDYLILGKTEEISQPSNISQKENEEPKQNKYNINGYIWLGIGLVAIIFFYFLTNIWT